MVVDNGRVETTKVNYELLYDVETLLGFTCVIFMLELMQGLSKFTQRWHTLICDFVSALKLCKVDFDTLYCDTFTWFSPKNFVVFLELIDHDNDAICLT
jgi:hypothetical protein